MSAVRRFAVAGLDGAARRNRRAGGMTGGSLDGAKSPVQAGYVTRGGRMLEDEAYRCLWNLPENIPDRDDPGRSGRNTVGRMRLGLKRYRLTAPAAAAAVASPGPTTSSQGARAETP